MSGGSTPNAAREQRGRGHELMLRIAHWRLHHRWKMIVPFALLALLPLLAYLLWPVLILTMSGGELRSASRELIARTVPAEKELDRAIDQATPSEIEQIGKLAFVLDPYPYPLPIENIDLLERHQLAGDETADRDNAYRAFFATLRESKCASAEDKVEYGVPVDKERLERARLQLVALQPGAQGIGAARFHYNMGLVQLCRGANPEAGEEFTQTIDEAAKAASASASDPAKLAEQFSFLGIVGRRLALVNLGKLEELPVLPDAWPGGAFCSGAAQQRGCSSIPWPSRRTELIKVHAFLADPTPDSSKFDKEFGKVVAIARGGDDLSPRAYTNAMLGFLKRGEFDKFSALASDSKVAEMKSAGACGPLGRLANAGWISGHLDSESFTFGCSGTDGATSQGDGASLPTDQGLVDGDKRDFSMLEAWKRIREDRRDLKAANFAALSQRARSVPDASKPVENDFVARVRNDLMRQVANYLLESADNLRTIPGGGDSEKAVLLLLHSDAFPFDKRWRAASALSWKQIPFWTLGPLWTFVVMVVLTLFSAAFWWIVWNALAAYALSFTRRHARKRAAAGK